MQALEPMDSLSNYKKPGNAGNRSLEIRFAFYFSIRELGEKLPPSNKGVSSPNILKLEILRLKTTVWQL